jgi:hypothetical protein
LKERQRVARFLDQRLKGGRGFVWHVDSFGIWPGN